MTTIERETFPAVLVLHDDGSLEVAGEFPNHRIALLPGRVMADLGLFDEGRPDFDDLNADAERTTNLLEMLLEMRGFWTDEKFNRAVQRAVLPGGPGPTPDELRFNLTREA